MTLKMFVQAYIVFDAVRRDYALEHFVALCGARSGSQHGRVGKAKSHQRVRLALQGIGRAADPVVEKRM
jgi:hypothetical protein